ncbi:MAG TPA: NHLP leader peptide family RiPP precursor [Longimicrobium sp.]|nr:NHLP leader peptide family RiPP precursor [Longimicrobium sp.]
MSRQNVVEMIRNNPELVAEGREQIASVLSRSATDAEFRQQLLTEPRAALAAHFGREIDNTVEIVFVENKAAATIVLPPFADAESELSEAELEAVAGGSEPLTVLAAGIVVGAALTWIGYEITH